MSKVIKQMEMDALKNTFRSVRDLVFLSVKGLSAQGEYQLRKAMRQKNVRVQVIKNSLARRVFKELGLNIGEESPYWAGPTALAWGGSSVSDLSRTLDSELKAPKTLALYKDKVTIKGAVADGQELTFEAAKTLPTREEAIAKVVMLALAPASRIVGQILGPASTVVGQIKSIGDKKEEEQPAA